MKKLLISLVVSAPLLLAAPVFAASSTALYNPELRTDTMSAGYNSVPTAGTTYAYYHHRHWHRWHHRGWHRYHYHHHYYW